MSRRSNWRPAGGPQVLLLWGAARGVGGTETRMAEVVRQWVSDGVGVSNVMHCDARNSRLAKVLEREGPPVAFISNPLQLRRLLSAQRPVAVLALGLRASLCARLACRLVRPRIRLLDARNGLELGRSGWLWRLDSLTQLLVACFVTNSRAAAHELHKHGISERRVVVLESALGADWQKLAEVERDPSRVIMVGNRRPEKNQELGIRAIAGVKRPINAVVYTDDASSLRLLWDEIDHDDSKSIEFIEGHVVSPPDMARSAVLLHPSVSESLPRVLLEARSQGVRVVATNVGDTAHLLGPGDFLVRPNDLEATTKSLDAALRLSAAGEPVRVWRARSVPEYCAALLDLCGATS